jgi:hypothetical protein
VQALFKTFLAIAVLTGRPQDLPTSHTLLAWAAVVSVWSNYIVDSAHDQPGARLLFALAQTLLLGGWVWAALVARNHPERWTQTMTAIYGSAALLNLLAWPLLGLLQAEGVAAGSVPLFFALVMTLWFLAIMSQILHHALMLPLLGSAALSFGILVANGWILMTLFPLKDL